MKKPGYAGLFFACHRQALPCPAIPISIRGKLRDP
jgi:hypothetical protein